MQKNVVIYFQVMVIHTKIAEHIAIGADAYLIRINENGDISQSRMEYLDNAKSIILGSQHIWAVFHGNLKSLQITPRKMG